MNYVHHNPVHHGYVQHWQKWPFSSAHEYLAQVGKEVWPKSGATIQCWITGKGG